VKVLKIEELTNKIFCGDCLEVMKDISDNSVDAVVTDPPYGLSFMGKKWDYDVPSVEIWQECLRVLKPGGYLLSFAGTRTQHRMAVRIEDAGFEIRDMIAWVYGSGFPKSLNIGKAVDKLQGNEREITGKKEGTYADIRSGSLDASISGERKRLEVMNTKGTSEWEGWGTALKPALEPITVARKPLSEKTVAENVLKWGTGGINIDGCRVGATRPGRETLENKNGMFGLGGGKITADIQGGRFPANLIHDGSDEVVSLFPNSKSTQNKQSDNRKNKGDSMFIDGVRNPENSYNDSGSASRFFYCAKASKSERNRGCEELEEKRSGSMQGNVDGGDFLTGSGNPREGKNRNFHPTVKPIALMEYLVKLVSREGAVVLDPFMGSGTTGVVCKNLKRNFIGIELSPKYIAIAKERLRQEILL